MKIVLVTDQLKTTGIGRYTWTLAKYLSNAKNQVSILYNGYFDTPHSDSSIELVSFNSRKIAGNFLYIPFARKYNSLLLKSYSHVFEDSIVHFCGSDYSGVKYFCNSVVTIHDLRFDFLLDSLSVSGIRNSFDSVYRDLINIKTMRDIKAAKRIIAISKLTQEQLRRNRLNSEVIHHWIDTEEFKQRDKVLARKTLSLSDNLKLILNVSSGTKNKRIRFLERVADQLPEGYKIIKIGFPLKSKNAINVAKVGNDIYPLYFNAADLYLNVSSFEGFGRPQIEAIGSELPVLATDIPINREVLGEAGMFFDISMNPHELTAYIKEILNSETDAIYLNSMKKQRLNLDGNKAIAAYIKIYKSVMEERGL